MAGVAACCGLLLAGCGGDAGPQDPETQAACRDLVAALPDRLEGLPRTTTEEYAVAWGAAVELRCGVPEPEELTPVSRCDVVADVDWFAPEEVAEDQSADAVLTTVGRDPRVEVTVPAELRPPVDVLTDLADAVRAETVEVRRCS
ncbi:DUF3515 domain-containing protein [Nocardioides aequoreus]|uniref:DUF3515 domain-containing protein n=1 Tax=Nocardioides aequoreus TaxID=397278 RepID=UPI00068F7B1F|nr:DUF3515 domain-containing protein [Nocardioides aequoreus]